jgi:heme/copper-type cytochrome/quinol oxidase subunit 2
MNFINDNANIFFFTTTIFVVVLIIIALVILFFVLRFYRFMDKLVQKGDEIVEKNSNNKFLTATLPILVSIAGLVFNSKNKKK